MNLLQSQPKIRLYSLVAVHLVAGLVMGSVVHAAGQDVGVAAVPFMALFLAQVALVAFWATLGLSPQGSRVSWCLVAIIYWIVLFSFAVNDGGVISVFLVAGYATIVLLPLRGLRKWVWRLDRPLQHAPAGRQFQLRHLFLLTFAISLLLAMGKWLPSGSFRGTNMILVLMLFVFTSGSVALAAVWSMLSRNSIWLPALMLLSYTIGTGWFVDSRIGSSDRDFYPWTFVFTVDATLLLASLGVVRYCGYRLVPLWQQNEPLLEESAAKDKSNSAGNKNCPADPFSN